MPTTLTSTQVERYTRDGFLSPNTALTREEARSCLAKLEADQRERRELDAGSQARRVRRYSAISSVAAIPWGIALVSDTNAWICPGYSRWTTFTPSLRSRSP